MQFAQRAHFWNGNKDQVCTMHLIFRIRKDKLDASVVMRSQDMYRGLVYDCVFFVYVQELMLKALVPTYPELKLGTYTHYAHSLHIYERDAEAVVKMLGLS
jgi:thymidylate synthase